VQGNNLSSHFSSEDSPAQQNLNYDDRVALPFSTPINRAALPAPPGAFPYGFGRRDDRLFHRCTFGSMEGTSWVSDLEKEFSCRCRFPVYKAIAVMYLGIPKAKFERVAKRD